MWSPPLEKHPYDRRRRYHFVVVLLKRELPPSLAGETEKPLGNDLLSREVALQVPSALTDLTTGFGMLPGVPPSLESPRDYFTKLC